MEIFFYVKFLSGKGRGAQGLTGRGKEENKASATYCAILWNDLRFCGMSHIVTLMTESSEFLDELQCLVHDLSLQLY